MSHCTHWTHEGEECCDCGHVFPHDDLADVYVTPCPIPESPDDDATDSGGVSRATKRTQQVEQLMNVVDRALDYHGFGDDVVARWPQAIYLEIDDEKYSVTVSRVGR